MTVNAYVTTPTLQRRLHEGPLGMHIDLYAAQLLNEGHCRQSAWRCLRVVSDFSHWLERRRISLTDVDDRSAGCSLSRSDVKPNHQRDVAPCGHDERHCHY
jgi:hypothetical protein